MNSVSNKKLSKIASDQAASYDPTWVQCIFSQQMSDSSQFLNGVHAALTSVYTCVPFFIVVFFFLHNVCTLRMTLYVHELK